jgi:hypothetical protein
MSKKTILTRAQYFAIFEAYLGTLYATEFTQKLTQNQLIEIVNKDLERMEVAIRAEHETPEIFYLAWLTPIERLKLATDGSYTQGDLTAKNLPGLLKLLLIDNFLQQFPPFSQLPEFDPEDLNTQMDSFSLTSLDSTGKVVGLCVTWHQHLDFSKKLFIVTLIEDAANPDPEKNIVTVIMPEDLEQALRHRTKTDSLSSSIVSSEEKMVQEVLSQFSSNKRLYPLLEAILTTQEGIDIAFCRKLKTIVELQQSATVEKRSLSGTQAVYLAKNLDPISNIICSSFSRHMKQLLTVKPSELSVEGKIQFAYLMNQLHALMKERSLKAIELSINMSLNIFALHQLDMKYYEKIKQVIYEEIITKEFDSHIQKSRLPLLATLGNILEKLDGYQEENIACIMGEITRRHPNNPGQTSGIFSLLLNVQFAIAPSMHLIPDEIKISLAQIIDDVENAAGIQQNDDLLDPLLWDELTTNQFNERIALLIVNILRSSKVHDDIKHELEEIQYQLSPKHHSPASLGYASLFPSPSLSLPQPLLSIRLSHTCPPSPTFLNLS